MLREADGGKRRAAGEDPAYPQGERRDARCATGPRRAQGPGDRGEPELGGAPDAGGGAGGREPTEGTKTTVRGEEVRPAPDLVDRDFTATGPDQVWVADITYIPTWVGFVYLAIVLDVWSRRIVGWAMATHLRKELVLDALDMALWQRRPGSVIHHSDQGSQYTSLAFGRRCDEADVRPSMGSVGDCYDNAMAESFFSTLECELLDRYRFETKAEAKNAVFRYIEGWYNPHRRHSALGYESPMNFETSHERAGENSRARQDIDPSSSSTEENLLLLPSACGAREASDLRCLGRI